MKVFEQYLKDYNIEPIRLAVAAGVRYLTVYNAVNEKPISYGHAQKIRGALHRLTGSAYTGLLPILEEPPIDQLSTVRIKKIPRSSI